jgi:hypothetical protein
MSITHSIDIAIICQDDKIKIAKEFCAGLLEKHKEENIFKGGDGNYHYVYLTINTVNSKFYVGKHTTDSLNDGYIGSGHHLSKAIKKYGKSSFSHYRLCFFCNEEDAYKEERLIVDSKYIEYYRNELQITYNLKTGGIGSTTVSEDTRLKQRNIKLGKKMSLVARRKMSVSQINARNCPLIRKRISEKAIESNNRPGAREKMSTLVREVKSNRTLIDLEGHIHYLSKEDVLDRLKQKWKFASKSAYLIHPELFKNKESLRESDYYKSIGIKDSFNEEYQYQTIIDYMENGWVLGCPSNIKSQIKLSEDEVKFYLEKNRSIEKRIKEKQDIIRKDQLSTRTLIDLEGIKQEVHINNILKCLKLGWKFLSTKVIIYHLFLNGIDNIDILEYKKDFALVRKDLNTENQYETLILYLENGWGFYGSKISEGTVKYWLNRNKELLSEIYKRARVNASKNKTFGLIDLDNRKVEVSKNDLLEKLRLGWTLPLIIVRIKNQSLKKTKAIVLVGESVNTQRQHLNLIQHLENGWELGSLSKLEEESIREEAVIEYGEYCEKRKMPALF